MEEIKKNFDEYLRIKHTLNKSSNLANKNINDLSLKLSSLKQYFIDREMTNNEIFEKKKRL
jgi:hypothetical protein